MYSTDDGALVAPADNSPAWVVHALLVRSGKLSVPTVPLGAIAGDQFVVFDQLLAPAASGVAPVHVRFISAAGSDGRSTTAERSAPATGPGTSRAIQ